MRRRSRTGLGDSSRDIREHAQPTDRVVDSVLTSIPAASSRGKLPPIAKNPPVGPSSASRTAQRTRAAPTSTGRAARAAHVGRNPSGADDVHEDPTAPKLGSEYPGKRV